MTENLNKASGNNYRLGFPILPVTTTIKDSMPLELNIFGTVMPGMSLGVTDEYFSGFKQKMAHGEVEYNTWNTNFTVDENWDNWEILIKWIKFISDNNSIVPCDKNLYAVDSSLLIYDNFNTEVVKEIFFESIWPSDVGDVELSERDGETYLECSCQFSYDNFKIGEK